MQSVYAQDLFILIVDLRITKEKCVGIKDIITKSLFIVWDEIDCYFFLLLTVSQPLTFCVLASLLLSHSHRLVPNHMFATSPTCKFSTSTSKCASIFPHAEMIILFEDEHEQVYEGQRPRYNS